ncbi:sugar phosphate nucleotidyltransferase [Paenibacillus sp. KN14-4R]|uniref:sugar phosphate nucleotidyltransferase n=1 Tax=Paenibacillus sp. KN14-4R TaxID=3445773 RepID=UPI003F9ECEB1
MKIVLLSGGSGQRLWPLSNEMRSKVFLKLLMTTEGKRESMIQRVIRQLDSAKLLRDTVIVTHESQIEIMINQIGDGIPILSEPYKRGTFTAIALAAAYFHSTLQVDPDEIIVCLPVDLFVHPAFFHILHQLPEQIAKSKADLALIGTSPKSPSSQFGYIVPRLDHPEESYSLIDHFVEKPDQQTAAGLIANHALWNCGVFAFSLQYMLDQLQTHDLPLNYDDLLGCYEQIAVRSFDHTVAEKAAHAIVIPYQGAWEDIGSWAAFTKHWGGTVIGSGDVSEDSIHTHLVNELPYPIRVIDVPDVIVAASPDGILIASKKSSNRIKELLQNKNISHNPRFEERRWGTCTVLNHSYDAEDIETLTKKIELFSGQDMGYIFHCKRQKIWNILSGSGEIILNEKIKSIQPGDVVQIATGVRHGILAHTPLSIIEVQIGTDLVEEDKAQIAKNWKDTLTFCAIE